MEFATALLLSESVFQLVVGFVLFADRGPRQRAMAILLFVNAAQPVAQALTLPEADRIAQIVAVADLATTPLIVIALRPHTGHAARWLEAGAWTLVGAQAVVILASGSIGNATDPYLRAIPYYAAMGALVVVAARGDRVDRWLSVAFLPRAIFFGLFAILPPEAGYGPLVGKLGQGALGIAALVALVLHARAQPAQRAIAFAGAILAVAAFAGVAFGPAVRDVPALARGGHIMDEMTLAVFRPLVLIVAFVPADLAAVFRRTILAVGVLVMVDLAMSASHIAPLPAAEIALAAALVSIGLAEALRPTLWGRPATDRPRAPASTRPQWQLILLALRGSSADVPRAEWTQQGLARATGISVKRISEFPRDMEARGEARLDAFLPGWRDGAARGGRLVEARDGAVDGAKGARVFYRLTPLGEDLAAAVARADDALTVKTRASPAESA